MFRGYPFLLYGFKLEIRAFVQITVDLRDPGMEKREGYVCVTVMRSS